MEPSNGQDHYTEKLLLIDGPAHARLIPDHEDFKFLSKLNRNDKLTKFVSGANFHKLTPSTISTWISILSEIPNSSLSLYPFGPAWSSSYESDQFIESLKRESMKSSISFDRIEIIPPFNKINDIRLFLQNMERIPNIHHALYQ